MAFEPVDVVVVDDTAVHAPVTGAVVYVYDQTGAQLFSSGVTDGAGTAALLLEPATYSLRFFKQTVRFVQPQLIEVSEGANNVFDVQCTVPIPPVAVDPRLCRASGWFKNGQGGAQAHMVIRATPKYDSSLIDGLAYLPVEVRATTDDQGYAELDLVRCTEYEIVLEVMEDQPREVTVPDSASVNFPDLVFNTVYLITIAEEWPYEVAVGGRLELTPTVVTKTGVPLVGPATCDVRWSSSDPAVVDTANTADKLVIAGVSVGTAELQAVRADQTIVRIPDTPIEGVPLTIIVS
jgi:hypothetical protein